eukprot:TRINITY_DN114192_c0_g1_i1.p1 TRINITY_DN114192_c0_g1~~TRINITY_DN114192_c0_g1_i1.p1  ORF type:complete len:336 (-),score=38.08 TRINITY_DN114192_c0_g1_i1:337-1344(-)
MMHRLHAASLLVAMLLLLLHDCARPIKATSGSREISATVGADGGFMLLQQSRAQGSMASLPENSSPGNATTQADFSQVGVLFAYDKDSAVAPGTMGNLSIQIAWHWANRHGYKVFIEKGVTDRAPQWLKVPAIQKYLPAVELLIFMDLDVFIIDFARTAKDLFPRHRGAASCSATPAPLNADLTAEGLKQSGQDIFVWAGEAGIDHYDSGAKRVLHFDLNLNDGLIAFSNHPNSFAFLQAVWEEGKGKLEKVFPHEMQAMHNVLLRNESLLSKTCILASGEFSRISLESPARLLGLRGPFAVHATGPMDRNRKRQRRLEIARALYSRLNDPIATR